MNFFIQIDEHFLLLTQRASRRIYLLIGIDNFCIAKICSFLSFVFSLAVLVFHPNHVDMIFSTTMLIAAAISFWVAYESKRIYRTGFMNASRPEFRGLRCVFACLILPGLFWKNFVAILHVGLNAYPCTLSDTYDLFTVCSCIYFTGAFYFASVEPEDPTDSILKKLLQKFKSLFESKALPQPA